MVGLFVKCNKSGPYQPNLSRYYLSFSSQKAESEKKKKKLLRGVETLESKTEGKGGVRMIGLSVHFTLNVI